MNGKTLNALAGRAVRRIRKERGWTQTETLTALGWPVQSAQFVLLEAGKAGWRLEMFAKFATGLGWDPIALLNDQVKRETEVSEVAEAEQSA